MILVFLLFLLVSHALSQCIDTYPYELDVGFYWARPANASDPSTFKVVYEKSCPPEFIPASFIPGRKTLILVHGAQPGIVGDHDLRFGYYPDFDQLVVIWLSLGWNVALFQWTQWADEPLQYFERAEAKIWTTNYFKRMEYTYLDRGTGKLMVGDGPMDETVAEVLKRHYLAHPWSGAEPDIRLVGHSLGAQLVIRAGFLIMETGSPHTPDRVAALDPVISPLRQGYLLAETCGVYLIDDIACMVSQMTNEGGIAVEIYGASLINPCLSGSRYNPLMLPEAAFAHEMQNTWGEQSDGYCRNPDLLKSPSKFPKTVSAFINQIYNQHVTVVSSYLLSLIAPPHRCSMIATLSSDGADGDNATAPATKRARKGRSCRALKGLALSAAMPTAQVLLWHNMTDDKGVKLCFHQYDDGVRTSKGATMTLDPGDDLYYVAQCKHLGV